MKAVRLCSMVLVLVFSLIIPYVLAQDYGSGGYDYETSGGSGSSGSGAGIPGGGSTTLEKFCQELGICTTLTLDVGIYCFFDGRDSPNVRRVVHNTATYYGYMNEDDDLLKYESKTLEETLKDILGSNYFDYFLEEAFLKDSWNSLESVAVPFINKDEGDDVRLYRYEGKGVGDDQFPISGGCRSYGGYFFAVHDGSEERAGLDQDIETFYDAKDFSVFSTPSLTEWKGVWNDVNAYVDVVWDKNEFDCIKITGQDASWSDASQYYDGSAHYSCCGDDYIWVNNRPLKDSERERDYDWSRYNDLKADEEIYAREIAINYCLYSSKDENEGEIIITDDMGVYYTCEATEFDAYDNALELDDNAYDVCYDDNGNLLSSCPYIFYGYDDTATDLGKWSASAGSTNPQVCHMTAPLEESEGIPQFAWEDVNIIGDEPVDILGNKIENLKDERGQTICESYLGGKWTGSHCCGNKYNYLGDAWDQTAEDTYFTESFSDEIGILYDYKNEGAGFIHNYACVQGSIIDTEKTTWFEASDGTDIELLNVDGNLYGCNLDQLEADGYDLGLDYYFYTSSMTNADLVQENYRTAPCALVADRYLCSNYPDAEENQYKWQWLDKSTDSYVKNTLRYTTGESFALSDASAWADVDNNGIVDEGYSTSQACCAGNSCWNGNECLDEYTIYYYGSDTDGNGNGDDVAVCQAGSWKTDVEAKYDWYYNIDSEAIDYCADDYSCVCSSNDDDNTFCTENGDYLAGGCTLNPNFYKDDHLCEAIDSDNDGVYDASQWTSRTKFLAFQMLEIATITGSDFTLFCDSYENVVNNYAELETVDDLNHVCVLRQNDQTIFGVTINWMDDDNPMVISKDVLADILKEGSDGLLDDAFGATITDCSITLGVVHDPSSIMGQFYACDTGSTTVYYNDKLNALIYAREGMPSDAYSGTALYYPGQATGIEWQDFITAYYMIIWDKYLNSGLYDIENPDGTDLMNNGYFDAFEHVQDYNSLYYRYSTSQSVFGFQELKYSDFGDSNRYFMGVVYEGYNLDCGQIYAAYDSLAAINCNSEVGVVLERNPTPSEHWNDLTAAIRSLDE